METKTKLELGHSIYFMTKNKVTCGKIISIFQYAYTTSLALIVRED